MNAVALFLVLAFVIGSALGLGVLLAMFALKVADWVYSKWQI